MYYIEGTIDAIEIFGNTLRFSLLPSSGHFVPREDGDKKALFINSDSSNATIVDPDKNVDGKEIVWFFLDKELRDVLLSAKSNRNTIRVWCVDIEKKGFVAKEHFSHPKSIKVEGVRVF